MPAGFGPSEESEPEPWDICLKLKLARPNGAMNIPPAYRHIHWMWTKGLDYV